jgi:hypothetical protein
VIILTVGILLIFYGIAFRKYSVWVGILFVLFVLGFQEGIPGDYMDYKYIFEQGGATSDIVGSSTVKDTEYSYIWLTQTLSKQMGFHAFVFLTAIVQCFVMAMMIRFYADNRYQQFGVLLVFFTFNIMLIQMKAMRQGYAADMILLAYLLLGNKRFILSVLAMFAAYGFHNSALLAVPFYSVLFVIVFVLRKKEYEQDNNACRNRGIVAAIVVAIGLLVFYLFKYTIFDEYVNPYLDSLDYFEYEDYLDQIENRSIAWWILLYMTASTFFVVLYFVYETNHFKKYLALIVIIDNFLSVGVFGFGNLMRVSMYFVIFSIVVLPNVAAMLRDKYSKMVATGYVIFNMVYLMWFSVPRMLSMNYLDGTGYGTFTFSFLNW